jgi:predicted metalloendopeptidase
MGDQIVSDIRNTFVTKLESTNWMEKAVKELAVEKVHKISQKIGYPTKVHIRNLNQYLALTVNRAPI